MTDVNTNFSETSAEKLKQFIARIEKLEADKAIVSDEIKLVYSESKTFGFDPKIIRQIIKFNKQSKQEREENEIILETYMAALGII